MEPHASQSAVIKPLNQYGGHTALGANQRETQSLSLSIMVWRGLLFQVWFHLITHWTPNLWWPLNPIFWCDDRVSGWWIYYHLFGTVFCSSVTLLPWIHGQGVSINPLPTWTREWGLFFLDKYLQTLSMVLVSSSLIIKTLEHDVSFDEPDAMAYSVSSGFLNLVSTLLIIQNCNLLLATNLIHCDARLRHYFCLYHL